MITPRAGEQIGMIYNNGRITGLDDLRIKEDVREVVSLLLQDYEGGRDIDRLNVFDKPDKQKIIDITEKLIKLVFPGYYREKAFKMYNASSSLTVLIEDVFYRLNQQILLALRFREESDTEGEEDLESDALEICREFFHRLPKVRALVETDLQADFQGDPAATSTEEIILAYPGLMASTVNRIAHELYLLRVPMIPRLMTEYAHSLTGIDIHPGATIGKSFFIDHGTGIVIGETAEIGENVKLYQGVTIGALSTRAGQELRGKKRHPTIQDNVTIYSGASVLGGNTVIGEGSVIGGNAFITRSVPKGTRVSVKNQELDYDFGTEREWKSKDLEQSEEWFYII